MFGVLPIAREPTRIQSKRGGYAPTWQLSPHIATSLLQWSASCLQVCSDTSRGAFATAVADKSGLRRHAIGCYSGLAGAVSTSAVVMRRADIYSGDLIPRVCIVTPHGRAMHGQPTSGGGAGAHGRGRMRTAYLW